MDIATIAGLGSGFGLIIIAMGSGIGAFFDASSAMIVIGGTIGAGMIHYRFPELKGALAVARIAFRYKARSPVELIKTLVEHAQRARREGILALEEAAQQTDDPFMQRALQLAVDGHEVSAIEAILSTEIDQLRERHRMGAEIFSAFGGYAPALGMIGTLVGLVLMLQQMDDPSSIGPAMAVALVTTFYGAILANLIFNPIAGKLKQRSQEEVLYKELVMEGVLAISQADNPRVIEQKLTSYLQPALRRALAEAK